MPIADDWDFDYPNTVLQHIDGVLTYDTGAGRQAVVGEYIRGNSSGAIGKVIALTGNTTSGTLTLTNTVGLFETTETFEVMSELGFDAVTGGNGGFQVGDRIDGNSSASQVTVRAIEYNQDGLGGGTIYGDTFTAAFTNLEQLDIGAPAARVQLDVANAVGVGVDNDAALTTTQTNGTLAVPGTANTNQCCIIHYDAGVVTIPEQAIVEDATTGAIGLVEQVYGVLGTGSVRIVNCDTTGGVFADNNTLRADQVIAYNNQVAGQVFTVGDVVVGGTSGATGRVLLDTGTELILAEESGTWTTTENLNIGGTKIAEANGTNTTLNLATLNLVEGVRLEQRSDAVGGGSGQGGIYAAAESLNVVRKLNSLYTLSQDTFDELLQMDDDEAMDASVKGGAYSLVFGWYMPDLSVRFLREGGLVDTTGANVWANPQTVGVQNKITDTAYLIDSTQLFRQPQLYIEQNGAKLPTWWLEGQIDVLVKVRTRNNPLHIAPATPSLGQLINGGDPQVPGAYTVFNREFHTSTYDTTQFNAAGGGVNTVALGTADDTAADRNPNGTHIIDYDTGSAATLLVGEEIVFSSGNLLKVGQVVAQTGDAGATGTVEYVLKSGTQFANDDSLTGSISGKTLLVNEAVSIGEEVAGYGADISFQVIDITVTPSGGTGITGTFIPGEAVTQAVTSATGIVVLADTTLNLLHLETLTGTFSGDNDITGDTSGASIDVGTGATYPSDVNFLGDLGDGSGGEAYTGSVSGNVTGASARTIQDVYQFAKYRTRQEEETLTINGPGTADLGTVGNLFRKLSNTFAEVKPGAPIGTFTGSMAFGQGWFLDTGFIDAADIRSFSVINNAGIGRNPPNLQALTIAGIAAGWRCAAYRSTGAASTTILRNEFDVGVIGSGNNEAADSTVLVGANNRTISPLPSDVPDSGVLRVLSPSGSNNTGNYIRMPYSSVDRVTNIFTLTGTIGSFLTAAGETSNPLTLDDNVHVVFIEEQAAGSSATNTIQYGSDINVVYKARLKGFKPFRSTGVFGSGGVTLGVVQNADTIVDLP